MTRLIFVTQKVDPTDPVLGVTLDLVRSLAERCERVVVVANDVPTPPVNLGVDIISLGKETAAGKLRRGLNFQRAIGTLGRQMQPDALVAHMCPIYLNLATPIAKAFRMRTLLWFAHPRVSATLIAAERLADCVITSLPGTYPRKSEKVHPIGQAINLSTFRFGPPRPPGGPFQLISLGRTAPEKLHAVTLRAVAVARRRVDITLRIVGPSTTFQEGKHRGELDRLIGDLDLRSSVSLEDPVPRSDIPRLLAESDCLVSATIAGSGDKGVFEAMAVGRPTLVSNPVFESMLQGILPVLHFQEGDTAGLAARIEALALTTAAEREGIGQALRLRVEREHSLAHWADRVVELAKRNGVRPLGRE